MLPKKPIWTIVSTMAWFEMAKHENYSFPVLKTMGCNRIEENNTHLICTYAEHSPVRKCEAHYKVIRPSEYSRIEVDEEGIVFHAGDLFRYDFTVYAYPENRR